MSFALKELTQLLSNTVSTLGVVIARDGPRLRIASTHGLITATSTENLTLGDRVVIQKGIAFKAPVPRLRISV